VWAPIALGAVAAPAIVTVMIGGLADAPVAIWVACAVLAMGLWIDSGRRADLAIATILLAGAASIKNEGILAAVIVLLVAAIVLVGERPRRRLRELGAAAAVFVIAILPWQLWAAAHSVPKDVKLGDALNPGYMVSHADRIPPAVAELLKQLTDESRWSYFLPLALLAGIVAIAVRRATRAAAFYLLTAVGCFVALVWAYWASPYPITWYLTTSGFRVVGVVAGVAMAAVVHLAPRLAALGPLGAMTPDVAEPPADEERAELTAGDDAPARRERVPAGLLAFWRA
jgi:4-amino-4-deoxy-L-arabinose transferase-like glycosyltransferase